MFIMPREEPGLWLENTVLGNMYFLTIEGVVIFTVFKFFPDPLAHLKPQIWRNGRVTVIEKAMYVGS